MKKITAVTKKEIIQILRDPLSLLIAFFMPVLLLFLFGYAISFDINDIPTIVCDKDTSVLSRNFISQFKQSGYFSIIKYTDNYKDVDRFIDSNKAKIAILIPEDFSKNINKKIPVKVEVISDGSDANTANIAIGYTKGVVELFNNKLNGYIKAPPIDIRTRVWFNPELKSRNFIVPGLIVIVMAVISGFLTSLTMSREWERGTLEQLISTPVKNHELIIGKLIPYFLIAFIDVLLALFMGVIVFGVAVKGSVTLLLAIASLFIFSGLSFGIFVSILAKSQLVANQLAMLGTFLPSFLLSGFIFSIDNMPKTIQAVTYIFPARYFMTILRSIFLKGAALNMFYIETGFIIIYGAIMFTLANKIFKRTVE